MTPGQELAVLQLEEIAAADNYVLEIEEVVEPNSIPGWVTVRINIFAGSIERLDGGLPLRDRERFTILVPPRFPFAKPEVRVEHQRFAGKPHVQWVYHLCLYQSPTEWNPSDGMFGLLTRLEWWLTQGARNQLDPEGEPLHPPAVYTRIGVGKLVIPRVDTPRFEGSFWVGLAQIVEKAKFIEITGWHDLGGVPSGIECAVAILFSAPLPWEYPTKGADLFRECERQGVSSELLFNVLKLASLLSGEEKLLYVILGSPMRGKAGGERKQHLSVWAIPNATAKYIQTTISKTSDSTEVEELRACMQALLTESLELAPVSWCPVVEDRPEVTVRRDHDSVVSYFKGKRVSIWGCGALGANVAIYLTRAGVRQLILYDKGMVTPGLLVRQPYVQGDIAEGKAVALAKHLKEIRPDLEVEPMTWDLEGVLEETADWRDGADVVIDATASDMVRRHLEMLWNLGERTYLAAMMVDRTAQRLATAVIFPEHSGAAWDAWRRAKIEVLRSTSASAFANSFFPAEMTQRPFQPEPGCSEPTFVGSAADSSGLAAIALNLIASELASQKNESAVACFFGQPSDSGSRSVSALRFAFEPDFVIRTGDYEVRITQSALREMKAWVSNNRRVRKRTVETGGLLWGEWDDATRILWVTDVSGPPPDSYHAETKFVCGVEGTAEEHNRRNERTRGAVGYIGMWHTHPISEPLPSTIDLGGMHQILTRGALPPRKNLLLIVGKDSGQDSLGAYLFRRKKGDEASAVYELRAGRRALPDQFL